MLGGVVLLVITPSRETTVLVDVEVCCLTRFRFAPQPQGIVPNALALPVQICWFNVVFVVVLVSWNDPSSSGRGAVVTSES